MYRELESWKKWLKKLEWNEIIWRIEKSEKIKWNRMVRIGGDKRGVKDVPYNSLIAMNRWTSNIDIISNYYFCDYFFL